METAGLLPPFFCLFVLAVSFPKPVFQSVKIAAAYVTALDVAASR